MASSNFDGAATPATPEPKTVCEAAPLPPQAGYIDEDGTFYPGFEGDDQSDCSDVASSVDVGPSCAADDDDDAVFAEKILQASPQPSAARSTTTRRPARRAAARPDIYSLRVMPAECYQHIAPPPVAAFHEEPMTEAAAGDVGDALIDDVSGQDVLSMGAYGGAYDLPCPHGAEDDFYAAPAATPSPQQPRPSRRNASSTSAQPAGVSGVMCCYFKQGHCHMGDQCWYAHEGADSTPCHYGAKCRKGHRNLVRSNAVPPVPKDAAVRVSAAGAAGAAGPSAPVPKRYVHEPKPKQSAPLRDSDMACPHCSEAGKVRLQDFPLFEGSRVRQATRGHCGECLRTFMLA